VDRIRRALSWLPVVVALTACAPGPMRVVSRGTLAYAAAWHGERLVTIELTERFELVVRDGAALAELARIDLGPAELDLAALAIGGGGELALVGGDDGWIRRIDLASREELDRWPQGAPITALAASTDFVAAGDAAGVVCLRRSSGELVQCVSRGETPIARLAIDGDRLTVNATDHLALPTLAPVPGTTTRVVWHGHRVRWGRRGVVWDGPKGARRLAILGDRIRAVSMSAGGKLVIAGWVRQLDQPSVVVWTGTPR
jgi:hypothetical protein